MANCPVKSGKEWSDLVNVQGLKMAHYLWDKFEGDVPKDYYTSLNDQLINGFLKDFGIEAVEYNNLKADLGIDAYTASDILAKTIAYEKGESITSEVAYFAYKMLGHKNDKLRDQVRYLVKKWDKYQERFNFHSASNLFRDKYIKDKSLWWRTINDLVVIDFLRDQLENYYFNKPEFEKQLDTKWTRDDFTLWDKFMRWVEQILLKFQIQFKSKENALEELNDLGSSIANDILDRNYEYFNYQIPEEAVLKAYRETIESDPKANTILKRAQALGLVSTGSLALRRAGSVYRTVEESIHDLDFVVPFELSSYDGNPIPPLLSGWSGQAPKSSTKVNDWLEQFDWFNQFKQVNPTYKVLGGFYGKEHKNDYQSLTVLGVIDGEYYDSDGYHEEEKTFYRKEPGTKRPIQIKEVQSVKHKKGDYVKGTGYAIDFFVRLTPNQEEHENYFKLWKEIMIAKLKMGRPKDFADWRVFVPFTKSLDKYNFYYKEFAHFNYQSSKADLFEDANGERKTVFQGTKGRVDNRLFNYYTTDQKEALNYGQYVRSYEINTAYFLQGFSPEYTNEMLQFKKLTGKWFDLLDNSPEGLKTQEEFFRYLMSRGFRGIDFTNYSSSNYVVEFKPAELANEDQPISEEEDAWSDFGEWAKEVDTQNLEKGKESDNPFC
jgi:hypothetical protein